MNRVVRATAPGKIILFGEHAVVYGEPAIAVPVRQVRATATLEPAALGAGLTIVASDLDRTFAFVTAPVEDPLATTVRLTLEHLGAPPPDAKLTLRSSIPIASGMGSGAAVSTAIVRALGKYLGAELSPATVSGLVFEVEKLHHGTPSGIDNTVVAFNMPVYYKKDAPVETFAVGASFMMLIGDTGVPSRTRIAVSDVRRAWESKPARYERLFRGIGRLVDEARYVIESGGPAEMLGQLMDNNHNLLREMGVSSPQLERLVVAARRAGALGAKLSGAGRGGNMIALIASTDKGRIGRVLRRNGAKRVIEMLLAP
ncbi:MAG: mevalonate kinase [Chloroflexota bacterium]|jgi:mevalonate kinase